MYVALSLEDFILKEYNLPFGKAVAHATYYRRTQPGPCINIKMLSYRYTIGNPIVPQCGDKTVVRSSYLHNGSSYTGKTTSLYWIRAQGPVSISDKTSFYSHACACEHWVPCSFTGFIARIFLHEEIAERLCVACLWMHIPWLHVAMIQLDNIHFMFCLWSLLQERAGPAGIATASYSHHSKEITGRCR